MITSDDILKLVDRRMDDISDRIYGCFVSQADLEFIRNQMTAAITNAVEIKAMSPGQPINSLSKLCKPLPPKPKKLVSALDILRARCVGGTMSPR